MGQYDKERRFARYAVRLPIEFELGTGVTRNISIGGICFDTEAPLEIDAVVTFRLLLRRDSDAAVSLELVGRVLRVEPLDDRVCVAASIDDFGVIGELPLPVAPSRGPAGRLQSH